MMKAAGSEKEKVAQIDANTNAEKRQRVQIDFSPEAYARLERMKSDDAKTSADVIRNALRLYEWFKEKQKQQTKIQLVDENGKSRDVELIF